MRGVILVAVAAVLGFFVLRLMDDAGVESPVGDIETADTSDGGSPDTTAASDEGEGGDEGESSDTTAAPAARPAGEVTVLVANASGVQGAAGAQSEAISQGGYQVLPADNAPENLDATQVLFVEGFEPEALVLAEQIGVAAPAEAVAPVPDPPPMELSGANVLVLLGPDLASG
jgi:hypothetical protein